PLHPAQGEPGGRHPDHLRVVGAVLPHAAPERDPRPVVPELREQHAPATVQRVLHDDLRDAGGVLRVLLRRDHVQSAGYCGQHPQVRRVHPGDPAWPTHGGIPVGRAEPHHVAGLAVPGGHRPDTVDLPGILVHQRVPLRRHIHPHHRGRGPGDHEAARVAADDEALRGLPPVDRSAMRVVLLGPQGAGKGTQARHLVDRFGLAYVATGDIFRWNIGEGTELGSLAKGYLDGGELVPDDVTIRIVMDAVDGAPDGFLLDGFPRTIVQAEALGPGRGAGAGRWT